MYRHTICYSSRIGKFKISLLRRKYLLGLFKLKKIVPDNTVQQSRERYRLKNTTILIKQKNRRTPTSAIIRQRNSQLNTQRSSTHR